MRRLALCTSLFALTMAAAVVEGQVVSGTPNFSAYDSHEVDVINLMNNNIILNVPTWSKPGIIPLSGAYSLSSYMGKGTAWFPSLVGLSYPTLVNGLFLGNGNPQFWTQSSATCPGGQQTTTKFSSWMVAKDGILHPLPATDYVDSYFLNNLKQSCLQSSFTDTTTDGSGITVTVVSDSSGPHLTSVHTSDGTSLQFNAGVGWTVTDSNNNVWSYDRGTGQITDTMGLIALTAPGNVLQPFNWTDVNGGDQQVAAIGSSLHVETSFRCIGIDEYDHTVSMLNSISFPDGTSLGITYQPQTPGLTYTGRIGQLRLREGGTVSYGYSGGNNGIDCTYATPPVLTRTLSNGDITTYTLAHTLSSGSAYKTTNTVVDPGGNKTVYQFTGFTSTGGAAYPTAQVLTQVQKYQGTSSLLTTDVYCYNKVFSLCSFSAAPTATVSYPISLVVVMHNLNGMANSSATETHYDTFGNITYTADYDFGGSTPVRVTAITYGSCTASCGTASPTISAIGSNINNRPGKTVTTLNGNTVAQTNYVYDSHGNLLTTYVWTGSQWLSNPTPNSYNANGTAIKTYDAAGNETDYAYSAANYIGCSGCTQFPFPTQVKDLGTGNYVNTVWYGVGGVKSSDTDRNGNAVTYGYTSSGGTADPFWRVMSKADAFGSKSYNTYPSGSSATTSNISFTFNSGSSINSVTTIQDGLGRLINTQKAQSPSGSNYDTVTQAYGWAGNYRTVSSSEPCSVGLGLSCTTVHVSQYDPLGRLYTKTTTGNESLTYTYSQNDDVSVLSPAPAGESVKQVQTEYDGLGRMFKQCLIGNGSSTPCGQSTGTLNGVSDAYSYASGPGYAQVSVTRGSQTRTQTFDALGRITQKTTPEGGTWNYVYDVNSVCPVGYRGAAGMLTSVKDPNGNLICYAYDSQRRVTGINAGNDTCRHFYYDNSTGYSGTVPAVVTLSNQYGRMVAAATDSCAANGLITDEWFAYDKNGRTTQTWQKSPHSIQYYHSVATFFENGLVKTLQLASPALYTITYGLDGGGRWSTLTDTTASTSIVTGTTFFPAANPAVISLQGTDKDSYTVDATTGRLNSYKFTVNSLSETGALTWNPNGTLKTLAVTDGFNSAGTQTCHFNPTDAANTGYDDWGRLVGADCGSGGWGQTFSYDQYDNLTKNVIAGHTGTNWNPGYSATNNHCNICSYDANGNVTADGNHTYGWSRWGQLKWDAGSGTPTCGTTGKCTWYDALGRIVETSNGSAWTERWLTQAGVVTMSGTSNSGLNAYWNAPAGGTAAITGNSTTLLYMHKDWLGSTRLVSTISNHTVSVDQAFSPYGEIYDKLGSVSTFDIFAGTKGDFDPGVVWDTPNRELSIVGRWLSPDQAGAGWNAYAYTTNPNSETDPSGLWTAQQREKMRVYAFNQSHYGMLPHIRGVYYQYWVEARTHGEWNEFDLLRLGAPTGSASAGNSGGTPLQLGVAANGGSLWLSPSGEALGSADLAELGYWSTSIVDILNSFHPQTPVWGPCPDCHPGCAGAGVPCQLKRQGTGDLARVLPGAKGSTFTYQVVDVDDQPVQNISLVSEYFVDGTGWLPDAGKWTAGTDLENVSSNGTFVDGVGMTPNFIGFSATQYFSAQVGGANYVISTSNSLTVTGALGAVFVKRSP